MADSSETLAAAELSEDATGLFSEELTAEGYIRRLSEVELLTDAIKYLAHTLGGRSCIHWSLSCLRLLQPNPAQPELDALASVEKWLADPTDANRRSSKFAAEKAKLTTPAGCLAMAAFFTGGSIAPPERDHVPVPPHVAQKIAAGAIILAVTKEPKQAAERYKRCLELPREHAA